MLCDLLALSGDEGFRIFDTAHPDGDLAGYFPKNSLIVDFTRTTGQIQIFDTILSEPEFDYVIDLEPGLLSGFFRLFNDIRFDSGAQDKGVTISIYFMLDRKLSTVRSALQTSRMAGHSAFIPVRNEAMGNVLTLPQAAGIYGEIPKSREIILPRLSVDAVNFLDQQGGSFCEFVAKNGETAPAEIRFEIWNFLESLYNQRRTNEDSGPVSL